MSRHSLFPFLFFLLLLGLQPVFAETGTADHGKFEELQADFERGEDVTRACLAATPRPQGRSWPPATGPGSTSIPTRARLLGKKSMLNGFCIGDRSNEAFCQSCHVGYGWEDETFDFSDETKVDCLACHNTGGYRKLPGLAGHPAYETMEWPPGSGKMVEGTDLTAVAQPSDSARARPAAAVISTAAAVTG
jgi:hypothetical protein